jgi:glycosyltransferase involved in cell wall biosynthesis
MPSKPNVVIYHDELLPPSETFILAQAESLSHFNPIYVGLRQVPGLQVPPDRSLFFCSGGSNRHWSKLKRVRTKLFGPTSDNLKRLRQLNPVLVHAHFGLDGTNAMRFSHALGIPLIVTFHGYDVTVREDLFRKQSLAKRLYLSRFPELAKRAACAICVSGFIQRAVVARHFPIEKTVVHYTGVNLEQFNPDPTVVRGPCVLFVGRLVHKKGCEYLINAMKTVQSRLPEAELVVIGDGPLRAELEKKASSMLTRVQFLGWQTPSEIRSWMNRSSVFGAPSVVAESGDAEGLPTVLLEAQSMGLPVAGFATGGIDEAVDHGSTGLLGRSHDCETLARNILQILTDRETWACFSNAGRRYVEEHFDLNGRQAAKLEAIYSRVLGNSRNLAPEPVLIDRQDITVPAPGGNAYGLGARRAAILGSEAAFEPPPSDLLPESYSSFNR